MAKKKSGLNVSEEVRKILSAKPAASNKDVEQTLESKFGKGKFNSNSVGVAASIQRKKLGISKSKSKSVKKRKPKASASGARRGRPPQAASVGGVDITTLRAAKTFLAAVDGDESVAIAAIKQLHSLQIG